MLWHKTQEACPVEDEFEPPPPPFFFINFSLVFEYHLQDFTILMMADHKQAQICSFPIMWPLTFKPVSVFIYVHAMWLTYLNVCQYYYASLVRLSV